METYIWVFIFLLLMLALQRETNKKQIAARRLCQARRNKKEKQQMVELAKQFIGKECILYTLNNQITGTVLEVSDGAVVLENNNTREIVNLDYIIRIREYPRNKNGKKKSVVLD